jgi:hypothetical protein
MFIPYFGTNRAVGRKIVSSASTACNVHHIQCSSASMPVIRITLRALTLTVLKRLGAPSGVIDRWISVEKDGSMFTVVDAFALAGGLVLVVIGAFGLAVTSGSRQRRATRQMVLGRSTLNALLKRPPPPLDLGSTEFFVCL